MTTILGKREFLHHASQYLKEVENKGIDLIITSRGAESVRISPVRDKSIHDLSGLIKDVKVEGDLNDPVLSGYDEW